MLYNYLNIKYGGGTIKLQERLKELRKENHMTQEELAHMLDMSTGIVAMWETGKRRPSYESLRKLELIFHRSMFYILGESDSEETEVAKWSNVEMTKLGIWETEEEITDLVLKYLRLDERGRRIVQTIIDMEYNICNNLDTLLPRGTFMVSIRFRGDEKL